MANDKRKTATVCSVLGVSLFVLAEGNARLVSISISISGRPEVRRDEDR